MVSSVRLCDSDSMSDRAHPASWWTVLSVLTAVLVALVCGVVLWAFMPPVVFFPYFALASSALVILGVVWAGLGLLGWFRYRALRASAVAPVLVVLTVVLVALSVPSRVAFAVSRNALAAEARQCPQSWTDQRIGMYRIWQIRPVEGGCLSFIEGGLIDSIGLAYLPDGAPHLGAPRRDGEIGYTPYSGPWYRFVQRFQPGRRPGHRRSARAWGTPGTTASCPDRDRPRRGQHRRAGYARCSRPRTRKVNAVSMIVSVPRRLRRAGLALTIAAAVGSTVGCGAGQISQTATQQAAVNGNDARLGALHLLNVYFHAEPTESARARYGQVRLSFTVVNNSLDTERLVSIDSPAASLTLDGPVQARQIRPGTSLSAGQPVEQFDKPTAPDEPLTVRAQMPAESIRPGLTHPVTFTFAEAGPVTLAVPFDAWTPAEPLPTQRPLPPLPAHP